MSRLWWNVLSFGVLVLSICLHNWANAKRPQARKVQVSVGSLRWWFPWPRFEEFPDVRTWQFAVVAQVLIFAWTVVMLGVVFLALN